MRDEDWLEDWHALQMMYDGMRAGQMKSKEERSEWVEDGRKKSAISSNRNLQETSASYVLTMVPITQSAVHSEHQPEHETYGIRSHFGSRSHFAHAD